MSYAVKEKGCRSRIVFYRLRHAIGAYLSYLDSGNCGNNPVECRGMESFYMLTRQYMAYGMGE